MSIKAAAYCRVSTDKEEQLSSLESQRKFFAGYIEKSDDWKLAEVYYDEGVSGTSTRHREGFQRMMEDAYAGKFQIIITKEVSRFARNTVDTLSSTRKLRELGIGVLFINDNINKEMISVNAVERTIEYIIGLVFLLPISNLPYILENI